VKKTIAAISASILGIGAAAAGGAVPAQAAPPQSEVKRYFGHTFWTEHESSTGKNVKPHFLGAFMKVQLFAHTATSQTYGGIDPTDSGREMSVTYRIASYGKATDPFPASCGAGPYQGEYEVTYRPTTTTFAESLGGKRRTVTVTYTPSPLFLGLNFDTTVGDANNVDDFNDSEPLCASSGGDTVFTTSGTAHPENFQLITADAATEDAFNVTTLVPQPDSGVTTPTLGSFAVTTTPFLATTGVDPTPLGLVGGGLLIAGLGTSFVGRRRRRTASAR
jgi:hypothetical protein